MKLTKIASGTGNSQPIESFPTSKKGKQKAFKIHIAKKSGLVRDSHNFETVRIGSQTIQTTSQVIWQANGPNIEHKASKMKKLLQHMQRS